MPGAERGAKMRQGMERLFSQPLVGIVTGGVTLFVLLGVAGSADPAVRSVTVRVFALAICLAVAVVLSYRFPIHVQPNTKIYMGSAALYLITVLLSPLVAGIAAGLSVMAGNLMVSRERGLYPSDMVTDASRWTLLVLAGSSIAHASFFATTLVLPYAAAGVVLWMGDLLTAPLLFSPMSGSAP